ncbi:hypothetical protein D3C76_939660 [compost metagenome]
MHFLRIGTVVPQHVGRDTLTEVSFEAIHANIDQPFQLVGAPLTCFRISKIIDRQTRLPFIPLPHGAIRAFKQIAFLF